MNSLNSSSVDARVETAIAEEKRKEKAGTSISGASKASIETLVTGVALRLTNGGVVVYGLEGAELIGCEDLCERLVDLIGLAAISLLTAPLISSSLQGSSTTTWSYLKREKKTISNFNNEERNSMSSKRAG